MKLYQTLMVAVATTGLATGAWAEGYTQDQGSQNQGAQMQSETNTQASVGIDSGRIENVQSKLQQEGYTVSADGIWGPQTISALRDFQRENDLSVTGSLNNETLAALDLGTGATNDMSR